MPSSIELPPPPDISRTLRYFRARGMFCDIRLRVTCADDADDAADGATPADGVKDKPEVEMMAHRVVLAAASPFFADSTSEEIKMPPEMTGEGS